MRVVLLGNVTETDDGISSRSGTAFYVDVTYRIQGCVLDVNDTDSHGWCMPKNNFKSINPVERLPWVHTTMFVPYDDYFSETPTQAEIGNFAMVHGFTPSLVEL